MSSNHPRRWLVLHLEAPLAAFGGVAIDNYGVTWDFPALSMLTGLFANALGYDRTEREAHQALQDRLVVASRRDDEPYHGVLRDQQNARVYEAEKGWTTRGVVESRNKGPSYSSCEVRFDTDGRRIERNYLTHQRFRDYHPDSVLTVVITMRTAPTIELPRNRAHPSLDDLARALDRPERPLFIGRKPCLPAWPLNSGMIEAETAHAALAELPLWSQRSPRRRHPYANERNCDAETLLRAQWPSDEGPHDGPRVDRLLSIPDRRNWLSGLHGGARRVVEGRIALAKRAEEAQ